MELAKSEKFPKVMSLESTSVGAKNYKFEDEQKKSEKVELKRIEVIRPL